LLKNTVLVFVLDQKAGAVYGVVNGLMCEQNVRVDIHSHVNSSDLSVHYSWRRAYLNPAWIERKTTRPIHIVRMARWVYNT
jgi:hypothetical protein